MPAGDVDQRKSNLLPRDFDVEEHVQVMMCYIKEIGKSWKDVPADQISRKVKGFVHCTCQAMWWPKEYEG